MRASYACMCVCMCCVCVHACMHTSCVRTCVCMYACAACIYVCVDACLCMHTSMYYMHSCMVRMHVCACMCMCTSAGYACMYVCMCICMRCWCMRGCVHVRACARAQACMRMRACMHVCVCGCMRMHAGVWTLHHFPSFLVLVLLVFVSLLGTKQTVQRQTGSALSRRPSTLQHRHRHRHRHRVAQQACRSKLWTSVASAKRVKTSELRTVCPPFSTLSPLSFPLPLRFSSFLSSSDDDFLPRFACSLSLSLSLSLRFFSSLLRLLPFSIFSAFCRSLLPFRC
jgi:hypothetical protein